MKNTILIITVLMLGITACEPFNEPEARIGASSTIVAPYENVEFYNYSKYADDYEWDFDNYDLSNEFEPIYNFEDPGVYSVRLSAFRRDLVSEAYITIRVLTPNLDIQVLEINDEYAIPGAKVILYPTLTDWDEQTNKIAQKYTNENGLVAFCNLPSGFYYMDISDPHHNNYILADDDIGFIKTPYIGAQTAIITAYVDYINSTNATTTRKLKKATTANKRTFDITKQERKR